MLKLIDVITVQRSHKYAGLISGSFIIAVATTHSSFLLGILCINTYSLALEAGLAQ